MRQKSIYILLIFTCLAICSTLLYAQQPVRKIIKPIKLEVKEENTINDHRSTPKVRKDIDTSRKKPDHIPTPVRPSMAIDTAAAQSTSGKSIVHLNQADSITFDQLNLPDIQVVMGHVIMQHDDALLYCDSAYINEVTNSFIAFGNVKIEQGDSVTIYSRYLNYDGNSRIARLKHKVKMINGDVTLTTDSFTYNRVTAVGYYTCGGVLQDPVSKLVSKKGYYNTTTKIAEFKDEVVGTNETSIIESDTLIYDTNTNIATIVGPTIITHNQETTIETELGWYNTDTDCSELLKNSLITHSDGKTLEGDTIFHDDKMGYSKAFHNVLLTDTANSTLLSGHYGFYQQEGDVAIVTDSALVRRYDLNQDTTYIHGDTLYTYAVDTITYKFVEIKTDSTSHTEQVIDSIEANMIHAFHNVRMYNAAYQGVCDSLSLCTADTISHMMGLPILWNEEKQITGDTIHTYPRNETVDRMEVINNAIIIIKNGEDTIHFNQMAGKKIVGFIDNQELTRIELSGNAESIFFPQEEDGYIIGLNKIESSYMTIYFAESKLDRLICFPEPKATLYPPVQMTENMFHLASFSWQEDVRPNSPYDVFRHPKRLTQSDIDKRKKELKEQEQEQRKAQKKERKKKKEEEDGKEETKKK